MKEYLLFFENSNDLSELTGLSREELWKNGFDLDDMDFGFRIKAIKIEKIKGEEYEDERYDVSPSADLPSYLEQLLLWMGNHCVGYKCVPYGEYVYFTLHHA